MLEDLSIGKILLILLVVVIFFGPKRIPDIAQSIGKGIREFKKAMRDVQDEIQKPVTEEPKATATKMIESSTPSVTKTDSQSTTELKS
ncbi:MAG: twin-arginine translocase TatA/TatE family subunit [Bacteroidetes bacterium]|nr:twin-arginine translocase TatA/TatE family subunit [Bacteroidota bacterium]MCL5737853.1 twin-arginine translocase TatA/TatE family subunit [Bacteroidota bacterium]